MNAYKQPEIEVIKFEVPDIKFEVPDIITTSSTGEEDTEHDNAFGDIGDLFKGK